MRDAEWQEQPHLKLSDPLQDRYANLKLIRWWDMDRVRAATVLVVGAGALGNEVIKNLALLGIGHILVVDMDTIEATNLSRSVLFRAEDATRAKAAVAAAAARQLNPDVRTCALQGDVARTLGLGVFRRVDAVIGCLDNREARLYVNRACWRVGQPWLDGAIGDLLGEARTFWPGQGACYECTLTAADYALLNQRNSCMDLARELVQEGNVPTTPTMASIVAALETQEALKLIHGLPVKPGSALIINGLTCDAYRIQYAERADCFSHERFEPIVECPDLRAQAATLRTLLAAGQALVGPDAWLVLNFDLLTAFACPTCQAHEAVLRPIAEVKESRLPCPVCGNARYVEHTHVVRGDEPFLDHSLAAIGIPPLDILVCRNHARQVCLELTGDAPFVLTFA